MEDCDLLSRLPKDILFEILSRMSTRQAVRVTTLLSKRWQNAWTILPCIQFHQGIGESKDIFKAFVSKFKESWRGTYLAKVKVIIDWSKYDEREIRDGCGLDSLLDFVTAKNVEDLVIDTRTWVPYYLPECMRICSSIKTLSLRFVHIKESVRWEGLRSFSWEGLNFSKKKAVNGDNIVDRVLAGSPCLEMMNLRMEDDVVQRYDFKSNSLKQLMIEFFVCKHVDIEVTMRIDTPKLEVLEMSGIWHTRCSMDVPSLKRGIICFDNRQNMLVEKNLPHESADVAFRLIFKSLCRVEELSLNRWSLKLLLGQLESIASFLLFPNVKTLKLCANESTGLLQCLQLFPGLQKLTIKIEHREFPPFPYFLSKPETVPGLYLPELKEVHITGDAQDAPTVNMVKILLQSTPLLQTAELQFRDDCETDPRWYISAKEQVGRWKRSSSNARVTITKW